MQAGEAEQAPRFKRVKTVSYWVLGTITAVPLTKVVESHYDVSFFSPAILVLKDLILSMGTWLAQPVAVQFWLLVGIGVCTLSITGALGWKSMDANRELKAKDAIIDANYARLDDIISELDSTADELSVTKDRLGAVESDLAAAYAKISELETPALPALTKNQDKVIGAIAVYDSAGKTCPTKEFPAHIDLTLLEADGAMDVLEARKMISFEYYSHGRYVTLTAVGRAYVLHPDFDIGAATAIEQK